MVKSLNSTEIPATNYPVKVLQFGEGNFLRAFTDWIIDILNEKTSFAGAVEIVQPLANGLGDMINEQHGRYHVVLNGIQHGKTFTETRMITCVKGVINPYTNPEAFFKTAENPDIKFIISNTTEAGIAFSKDDKTIDQFPSTFPGKLTAWLHHRFTFFGDAADKGLIFLPCELIDKNGEELRKTVLAYCAYWNLSDAFVTWIAQHNTFCNTLVDRIVPGFPKETIQDIQNETGYDDKLVVMAEPFHLWVIEGPEWIQDHLPTAQAGLHVKFVPDLAPYRTQKVRILNGAHTAMVPIAYLQGLRTVRESIEDTAIGEFIRQAIFDEIIPTLDLPKNELKQFANDVIERFQNPFIKHELLSIALNSISKYKVRVLPTVLAYQKQTKKLPTHLVKALAALLRFYKGEWQGEHIPLTDSPVILEVFAQAWSKNTLTETIQVILSNTTLWDQDLTLVDGLAEEVLHHLHQLESSEVVK